MVATSCRFESDYRHHVGASCISLAPTFLKIGARSFRCFSPSSRNRFAGLRFGFGCRPEKSILAAWLEARRGKPQRPSQASPSLRNRNSFPEIGFNRLLQPGDSRHLSSHTGCSSKISRSFGNITEAGRACQKDFFDRLGNNLLLNVDYWDLYAQQNHDRM